MNNFEIIPAVDILDGKCVRLEQGDFNRVSIYSQDPFTQAKKWEDEGAVRIHLVDLNAAKSGVLKNIEIIKPILKKIKIPIQVSGGIRSLENVKILLEEGAHRVVIGTVAVENQELLKSIAEEFKNKVLVSLDARGQFVAIDGWLKTSNLTLEEMLKRVEDIGIERIVYTDISRDGVLKGLNFKGLQDILRKTKLKIIASGGISSIEDVKNLKKLAIFGLEGCIIGRALYTGQLSLKDILKI